MNINVQSLQVALKNIRRQPTHGEDVLQIPIYDKLYSQISAHNANPTDACKESFATITLVAKKYCKTQYNCWYEWEIEL